MEDGLQYIDITMCRLDRCPFIHYDSTGIVDSGNFNIWNRNLRVYCKFILFWQLACYSWSPVHSIFDSYLCSWFHDNWSSSVSRPFLDWSSNVYVLWLDMVYGLCILFLCYPMLHNSHSHKEILPTMRRLCRNIKTPIMDLLEPSKHKYLMVVVVSYQIYIFWTYVVIRRVVRGKSDIEGRERNGPLLSLKLYFRLDFLKEEIDIIDFDTAPSSLCTLSLVTPLIITLFFTI